MTKPVDGILQMQDPYLPDGVTQADIDRYGEGYDDRCGRCKQDPCECCESCGADPDETCEPECDCRFCQSMV